MATGLFRISPYDNQISLLYKAATQFETPTVYITVRDREAGDVTTETQLVVGDLVYEPLIDVLFRTLQENPDISISEAYTALIDETSTITPREFAFTFNTIALSQEEVPKEEIFSIIQEFLGKEAFHSITDLKVYYDAWRKEWENNLKEDSETLERILNIQSGFDRIPDEYIKATSDLVVDRVTLRSFPLLMSGEIPTSEDALDIFNSSRLSYFVPYIHYNEGDITTIRKTYYKIYRGETAITDIAAPGAEPNLGMIIPTTQTRAGNKGNLIYATVWTGDDDQVITRPTREGYTKAIYDLDTGEMTFTTRISQKNPQAKELLIKRIGDAFPGLVLGEITETRISGEFDIFLDEELLDYVLLEEILNNPIFTAYLYVDERQKAYPEKKRITIHYRSILGEAAEETARGNITQAPASVSAIVGQLFITDDQATPEVPVGTPFIKIKITRAASREVADQFRDIFVLLMGIYLQDRDMIEERYLEYIPPFEPREEESPRSGKKKKVVVKKGKKKPVVKKGKEKRLIYQNQDVAPDVFLSGFARKCQGSSQPSIITPDDVPGWQKERVFNKATGEKEDRQVMPFPPNNSPNLIPLNNGDFLYLPGLEQRRNGEKTEVVTKKDAAVIRSELDISDEQEHEILAVCPNDKIPFPGVKINQLDNSNVYPYIPCCYKTDHTLMRKKNAYNAYYRQKVVETQREKRRMKISTAKFVAPGGEGDIPVPLERILLRYSTDGTKFKRYGVVRDPNSLIHCVLEAVNHKSYNRLSEEDKVALTLEVRRSLVTDINIATMKQELYDFTLDDIKNQILTEDLFFDPALYYRALEELFGINIYVFVPGKKPKEEGEAVGKIELPRHKLFHSRPLRLGRDTILIFKHFGSEADAPLGYPQCELLVDRRDSRNIIKVFSDDMTQIVHDVLVETFPTTTWMYRQETPDAPPNLVAYTNLYSLVNFDVLTGQKATAQIIDDYGKLRAFLVPPGITVYVIPSQPENLPIAEGPVLVKGREVEKIFGDAIAINLDERKEHAIGLWFSHEDIPDYPYAIFVPIIPSTKYLALPEGPLAPVEITQEQTQTVPRILLLTKQISFLLQIIRWLFLLADLSVGEFMKRYTKTNKKPVEDSSLFYNLSQLQHRLPTVETVEAAIAAISPSVPTLFDNNRFVLYSPRFAEKIKKHLESLERQSRGLQLRLPRFLENYYIHESDFDTQARTIILIGEENFNTWLASFTRAGYRGVKILTLLDVTLIDRVEPYLYLSEDGSVYLIQNVEDGDIEKALQVSLSWSTSLTNPGFNTIVSDPKITDYPYRVYEISPSLSLRMKKEVIKPDASPDMVLEILRYDDNNYYAALIRLS